MVFMSVDLSRVVFFFQPNPDRVTSHVVWLALIFNYLWKKAPIPLSCLLVTKASTRLVLTLWPSYALQDLYCNKNDNDKSQQVNDGECCRGLQLLVMVTLTPVLVATMTVLTLRCATLIVVDHV